MAGFRFARKGSRGERPEEAGMIGGKAPEGPWKGCRRISARSRSSVCRTRRAARQGQRTATDTAARWVERI